MDTKEMHDHLMTVVSRFENYARHHVWCGFVLAKASGTTDTDLCSCGLTEAAEQVRAIGDHWMERR